MSRVRSVLAAFVLLAAACGGDDAGEGAVDGGDDGGGNGGLIEPIDVIAMPYIDAGGGAVRHDVAIANLGGYQVAGLTWQLDGNAEFTIVAAPERVAAESEATLTLAWAGAATPRVASATLTLTVPGESAPRAIEVWAVAGDPALGPASFSPVTGPGGVAIGDSAVLSMPTAPFPASGSTWTDDRVHLFVPAGYRDRPAQDLVLHFHGHNTTIDATVPAHRYREQVFASGANVVLVVPQGPVNAASGVFGKLDDPAGTAAFLDQVMVALYRAGRIRRPVVGEVTLTSHSGGYAAVARNLADASFEVTGVDLFDSLYGFSSTYQAFVIDGGRLRSNYTASGGTDGNNQALVTSLGAAGVTVATAPTQRALRAGDPVIYFTAASHNGATGDDTAFGEQLRWGSAHTRSGPRVELRASVATAGTATLRWLAPPDPDIVAWRVERSDDGVTWDAAVEVDAAASEASFPIDGASWVRVVSVLPRTGVGEEAMAVPAWRQRSDVQRVASGADVLIVDGFDRLVDGSWGGLSHDFAARVGAAAGAVHTVSNEAITEDGFDLAPYRAVIWLLGDESTTDHTFTAAERAAIDAYLDGGGRIIISGSEVGYELGAGASGAAWLADVTGAVFASDDAGSNQARGVGPLAGVALFGFGGAAAPYPEEYPDRFTAGAGATVLLEYATGTPAAVGLAGRGALVGFPLETTEDPAALATLVTALLAL